MNKASGPPAQIDAGLTPEPAPELTEDGFLGGRLTVHQPRSGFRAGTDSVFLAAAVPARPGQRVFEPGAGVGVASLCLACRIQGVSVSGVEIQPDMVRLAGENARRNGLENRVEIMIGALERLPPKLTPASFDHVMLNPPFLPPGRADAPPDAGRAVATIEGEAGLESWIVRSLAMLRAKGSLTVIHRADRLDELLSCLTGRAGEIVVFPLWPGPGGTGAISEHGKPAKRVIVRARKGVASPLRLAPGLVLHEGGGGGDGGDYTPRADAVLRGAALEI